MRPYIKKLWIPLTPLNSLLVISKEASSAPFLEFLFAPKLGSCYAIQMGKPKVQKRRNIERKVLALLTIIFAVVMAGAWLSAMSLKQTIAAKNSVLNVSEGAQFAVEKIRNVGFSKLSDSRSFFLLGSKNLFDEQNKEQQTYRELLEKFQADFSLPQIFEPIRKLQALSDQEQEIFDQAMKFREQQTESKIVGQFYQSKIVPIRQQMNEHLNTIIKLHDAELTRAKERVAEAAAGAEAQIPQGMSAFTIMIVSLFFAMAFLVIRMTNQRMRQFDENDRLYDEATRAIQVRDEVMVAINSDLNEPLETILQATEGVPEDHREIIKSAVAQTQNRVKDILDQAKSDTGIMSLRLDQIGINDILSEARFMLQPLAKQKDIRLQVDLANPPVLAFFDRERVLRVIANLAGNAIKFSPRHGKVSLRVRSDQQFVHVSVQDSSPCIPEKQLPQVFDRTWQANKLNDLGAGVGLAVAREIITAHGGTIRVESIHGSGNTFTFTLPRRRPVGAVLPVPKTVVRSITRSQSSFSDGPSV